jgi:AcrR family transcriptional regulator
MPKVTEEHRAARRQQIVDAGRRCVIEQGFHKTTMADVIRESGLSAGAVYGYFRSKDEIVAAIADQALSEVDAMFEQILDDPGGLTPERVLRHALDYVVRMADAPTGDVTRVALQVWAEAMRTESVLATARGKYRMLREHFADVARRGQADGTIRADVDPDHVGQALFGLVPGFILQRLILGDVTPESYAEGFTALLTPR